MKVGSLPPAWNSSKYLLSLRQLPHPRFFVTSYAVIVARAQVRNKYEMNFVHAR
ncbi:hypothetical protein SERLA73DRAFT_174390 [Serpula lacrymans var. lacrymans S7.3]|uniref:Uncharacterized protein n=2 Tax=Serpula lacrymans var. lacrymans TaxID=341189 RepID=F8PFL0_SERL3|nr:uncharacterized protein SERLADRAFT_455890 [Serpula lacrymans var. lacrymans S7.9]EGO05299.1 hypothetical protein SERLA73DRAFT_174390 [Serpula lacrymans var. lacrymans S7.3]EGO31156.1 hypothetical protein SERLADRAFT_455890 [Serpula lacrymans var. lacrymans S7.9]